MSLSDWAANGWVVEQEFSASEIRDMLAAADRDMAQCQVADLDPDWRLNIAYNASLRLAAAAPAASGYRAAREANHYRLICSLEHTIGSQAKFIRHLDTFRKKRNVATYEHAGAASARDATEALDTVRQLRAQVMAWFDGKHPGLL